MTTVHAEVSTYIHQVADQLNKTGITITHAHIDTPEQAAYMGREYARLELANAGPAQSLIWTDHNGWMTSTWTDHYPLLPGQIHPTSTEVAREVASHIHTLNHGGHLQAV